MKKLLPLLLILLAGCKCISGQVVDTIHENNLGAKRYVVLVEQGKTTRDQDRAFIKQEAENWAALDAYVRGEKPEDD